MKKILVIEDEPEMRRNITALLRYNDYQPIAAENGLDGVEAARREKPDLILCDVMMPKMDGYGVLQAMQKDSALASVPFIFLTAKGEKDDLRDGMNLGADDYLTKPVANADLIQAIETRLRRSEQQGKREFTPDFSSFEPLLKLGLTPSSRRNIALARPGQNQLRHCHDSWHYRIHGKKARSRNIRKGRGRNSRCRNRSCSGNAQRQQFVIFKPSHRPGPYSNQSNTLNFRFAARRRLQRQRLKLSSNLILMPGCIVPSRSKSSTLKASHSTAESATIIAERGARYQ